MTAIASPPPSPVLLDVRATDAWPRLLAWSAGAVAAVDLIFFALIQHVIPPLAAGALLTGIGLVVLRRSRRWGIGILGVTGLVMLLGNAPFALGHLPHPESGIDWVHSVVGLFGRLLVVVAAVAAWRGAAPAAGRRLATVATGLLGAVVVIAAVASLLSSGVAAADGDVAVPIERGAFPAQVTMDAGGILFADNQDLFRHTFTVEGTAIDVELPARQAARIPVDLAPGTYDVLCAVPGHDGMTSTLTVR
jgi:plastocyanin